MEETLITFETAKIAKDKGYDIACMNVYLPSGTIMKHPNKIPFNYNNHPEIYYAPTQSLLHKWFMEKHNLFLYIIPRFDGFDGAQYGCHYCIYKEGEKNEIDTYGDGSYSYEEAFEKGLQEMFELI